MARVERVAAHVDAYGVATDDSHRLRRGLPRAEVERDDGELQAVASGRAEPSEGELEESVRVVRVGKDRPANGEALRCVAHAAVADEDHGVATVAHGQRLESTGNGRAIAVAHGEVGARRRGVRGQLDRVSRHSRGRHPRDEHALHMPRRANVALYGDRVGPEACNQRRARDRRGRRKRRRARRARADECQRGERGRGVTRIGAGEHGEISGRERIGRRRMVARIADLRTGGLGQIELPPK